VSGGQRHTEPVDVHLILLREGEEGPEVLLSRRAGQVYAAGLWHLPSGHLDGPHEDVVAALVREAREETRVVINPGDVRSAVTVHHRSPKGSSRTGYFFEVRQWEGEPQVAEPDVCDAMQWARLDALPDEMVAYCRAGLDAYKAGARIAVHFQLPGDAIAYAPGSNRLRLVPDATGPAGCLDLYEASVSGYGRSLTPAEEARLVIDIALDAMSGIQFGAAHGDPELVERGHRMLARLRAERRHNSPMGEPS